MDSRDSSPHSRDDNNNNSFPDEHPPTTAKVKLMCSYGGKIQPRPHDNHLTYVSGDTKILTVDRSVKFPSLMSRLSSLTNASTTSSFFKYQLPGEDLDALISVTNDEDLHHMMLEYDRLCRSSPRPARLRLFLFPLNNDNANSSSQSVNFGLTESKQEPQWFVDALNSLPLLEPSPPPPPPPANPDFLFGLDKPYPPPKPTVPDIPAKDSLEPDDRHQQPVRESELEIHELQKLQPGNNEKKIEEDNGGVYGVDSFPQKNAEKVTPLMTHANAHPGSFPFHETVPFLQERNNASGGVYSLGVSPTGNEPVYLIQTPSGIYQAVRPVTGPVGQPVYLIQTPNFSHPVHKVGYGGSEVGLASERGFSQVAYLNDRSGLPRQTAAGPGADGWN